ncbi:type II toxin-antitoxin system RelE/ParE family toxin [Pasteurella skyensis]|uniref:Type II toxin-antitoxin system RelE/ParE family toxin n=1 Tax=Phocoenobacter skyensis TaxID=97481 RepID=A0AAJ6N9G3_9PAST|nr:type II toxin-antitoxin system RelE/ParE family toxin [Pasteurella skyensis]MDP8162199.1 type II toxin-antitoxin system RelE/ParE family toxin [Pasteurella skyensis]MDP8172663.1 type II toxin-antitoxin system RelE/ParE family toxin [Pasteurella skyensis]MDP8176825.1 type II toxin-antitoxin system RelE/ParE family toxin [Pasteurella skyensis]MDP8179163.1 type II toxin-antitoxin system RelE/ParE family toxin [Pasteurella skyensis]MDP8183382.1 type II toxin-antitoxin system RelE/ParE family to
MFYKVIYHKKAQKFIQSNKIIGLKFIMAFDEISTNKDNLKKYDVKKFHSKEFDDIFRLRIGKNRAIFRIINDQIVIYVLDIGSRGDIYK